MTDEAWWWWLVWDVSCAAFSPTTEYYAGEAQYLWTRTVRDQGAPRQLSIHRGYPRMAMVITGGIWSQENDYPKDEYPVSQRVVLKTCTN